MPTSFERSDWAGDVYSHQQRLYMSQLFGTRSRQAMPNFHIKAKLAAMCYEEVGRGPAATREAVLFLRFLRALSFLLDSGFQGGYGPQRRTGPMARQNLRHHHRGAVPY